ncbi:hypothetical protein B5M44_04210 [Shinella sumterensis]|uniref:HNH endonuclease n=1 Tax=Shinella sumterensis TaxID=1967501 RepID=UPI00106E915A|nr:HNH endonuclease [Shinella sumterensis]MCD1264056.1 HNH endonuclease [Shinella sumterensis]TFE99409.1 hypothetical protein B5M44_04210 [Shinella sumterensis]
MHHAIKSIIEKYSPLPGYAVVEVRGRPHLDRRHEGPLTSDRLRSLLFYDPNSGIFTWRVDRLRVRAGDRAGKLTRDGYIHIGVDGGRYAAHRLAFLYMTGTIPEVFIDHKNRNRSDNRWDNLRVATNSQNQMNTDMKSNNTSGFKGVSWHKAEGKWRADIRIGGAKVCLGYFDKSEEAHEAYLKAVEEHHGEFARAA